ncbi:hypothetical protein UA74_20075 [Actinoalloteichus fjordicus]|uniref:Uncharacterized protein n=1 Tax=Actinoalloteichus fjordicus TaxID=1612552 RepID=A0AAC9PTG6_9PSEU|nr:hypothetical protein UA74_20075 [Actinoalloteichus fjordicus]
MEDCAQNSPDLTTNTPAGGQVCSRRVEPGHARAGRGGPPSTQDPVTRRHRDRSCGETGCPHLRPRHTRRGQRALASVVAGPVFGSARAGPAAPSRPPPTRIRAGGGRDDSPPGWLDLRHPDRTDGAEVSGVEAASARLRRSHRPAPVAAAGRLGTACRAARRVPARGPGGCAGLRLARAGGGRHPLGPPKDDGNPVPGDPSRRSRAGPPAVVTPLLRRRCADRGGPAAWPAARSAAVAPRRTAVPTVRPGSRRAASPVAAAACRPRRSAR